MERRLSQSRDRESQNEEMPTETMLKGERIWLQGGGSGLCYRRRELAGGWTGRERERGLRSGEEGVPAGGLRRG